MEENWGHEDKHEERSGDDRKSERGEDRWIEKEWYREKSILIVEDGDI